MSSLDFSLFAKQSMLFTSPANEILYGGAAGGGKSYAARVIAITACLQIDGLQVYLFRRNNKDLKLTHLEGRSGFKALLSKMKGVDVLQDTVRFNKTGSRIYLCHADKESDVEKYKSAEIDILMLDEASTFTEFQIRFLRQRLRGTALGEIPEWLEGRLPLALYLSNPSGASFEYLRDKFVFAAEPMQVFRTADDEGGMLRQFIPALLTDNPALMKEDPLYAARIRGMGDDVLIRQYLYGDWSVQTGAFFNSFNERDHVIAPRPIPSHWMRFKAMDWGSYAPSAVLWFAVSDGSESWADKDDLIVYRELYTCQEKDTKLGLKLTADELAQRIKEVETDEEKFSYFVADPSIVRKKSDIYRGETFSDIFRNYNMPLLAANNKILDGCNQMRQRFKAKAIKIFTTCRHLRRTVPLMIHDAKRPEVYDSSLEDHLVDTLRYGGMSNMYSIEKALEYKNIDYSKPEITQLTYEQLGYI